jgi:molecular chaperone GrpE (heat shock protein)
MTEPKLHTTREERDKTIETHEFITKVQGEEPQSTRRVVEALKDVNTLQDELARVREDMEPLIDAMLRAQKECHKLREELESARRVVAAGRAWKNLPDDASDVQGVILTQSLIIAIQDYDVLFGGRDDPQG